MYNAYSSLYSWEVEEGIIDGEEPAIAAYMSEVEEVETFSTVDSVEKLNQKLYREQAEKRHQEDLKLAKERGYEYPKRPDEWDD